jgi:NAD+ synthase (glutamine-hydrolysing)
LARDAGAQVLAVLNASPFHAGKGPEREQRMRERVADSGLPLVYAHLVGGQDEVIFEGPLICPQCPRETGGAGRGLSREPI